MKLRGDPTMPRMWTDEETRPFQAPWWDAYCLKVTDGDTIDAIYRGPFDGLGAVRIRLIGETGMHDPRFGVDAWETRGEERELGEAAKARVLAVLEGPEPGQLAGTHFRIYSRKGGSRGSLNRWLCAVFVRVEEDGEEGWVSLGDALIEEGHAEEWWRGRSRGRDRPE